MKTTIIALVLFLVFCVNAFAKDKVSPDGYIYHKTCNFILKGDPNSKHKYLSKKARDFYVNGYCVVNL